MVEIKGWMAVIISALALITTWIIARNSGHKSTHKDIYKKIDELKDSKADKTYVEREMEKISTQVNEKIDDSIEESKSIADSTLELIKYQAGLISSIDSKLNILINKLK